MEITASDEMAQTGKDVEMSETVLIAHSKEDAMAFAEDALIETVKYPQQIGIVTISMQLLADLLHFPEGHKIIDVRRRSQDFASDSFQILCEGPTLPVTGPAEYTPTVQYAVTQTDDAAKLVPKRRFEGKFSA